MAAIVHTIFIITVYRLFLNIVQYLDYDQTEFEFVFAANDTKVTPGNSASKPEKPIKKLIANFILILISFICCAEFTDNQAVYFHLLYYLGHFCYGSIVMIGKMAPDSLQPFPYLNLTSSAMMVFMIVLNQESLDIICYLF